MKDEMDILKEVGGIAAAHGSTALSEMLGRKVNLSVPTVMLASAKHMNEKISTSGSSLILQTYILTGLKKETLFIILNEKAAYRMVDICCHIENIKGGAFTEMAMSLIKEIGNVVNSAYIAALGHFLNRVIIPSIPVLINAPFSEVTRLISTHYADENSILIESVFEAPKENITGNIWLILTPPTAEEIKQACKRTLDNI